MRMESGRTEVPTKYAERGTVLHAVAATCLNEGLEALEVLPDDVDGAAIVQAYLNEVRFRHSILGGELLIEQQFHLQAYNELYWGTADCVIVAPPHLWVGDLKTGQGHAVPIRREDGRVNLQLGGYGLGALSVVPRGVAIETVELSVVQPLLGPPRSTRLAVGEVQDLAADLIEIAEEALKPDAPLSAGEHCTFCRARGDCPELRRTSLAAASVEFSVEPPEGPTLPPVASLTPSQVGQILTAADLVETWIDAVRLHGRALVNQGETVPGWKMVDKRGRRVWIDELAAARTLDFLPVEDLYVTKVASPPQVEKAFKRLKLKLPKDWSSLVTKTDPGTALVPDADPRPAVTPRAAALDFQTETEEQ